MGPCMAICGLVAQIPGEMGPPYRLHIRDWKLFINLITSVGMVGPTTQY